MASAAEERRSRKMASPCYPAAGGERKRGAEGKKLRRRQQGCRAPPLGQGYFTVGLALLFLCLTALLVFLPLLLPPLPPPPLLLMLLPVGLMAVLLALALVPPASAVASLCLH